MEIKETNIRNSRKEISWAYSDLKRLTEEEAKIANNQRDELLKSLDNKVSYSFRKTKIHIGKLSPGCLICARGYWSCLFINALCTAHCFYCPQDRKINQERTPYDDEMSFDNPKDYVDYLKVFNFKGVGFSGGETLLVFDKLISFIKEIRKRLGNKIYLWIYTNGDLVNEDKIRKLKECGLDEVRFNISVRNYDLHPVELATKIMDTVTVEIPSIPEDYEIAKRSLIKMQKIGVKHLNMHQLITTQYNYKNYIKRGYTVLHHPQFSIFESEINALKFIKFALDKKIGLPINYCTSLFKNTFQGRGVRVRKMSLVKDNFEELTHSRYIRKLSIKDSPEKIKTITKILHKNNCQNKLWSLNDANTEIFIHSSLLKYIDFRKYDLVIAYLEPCIITGDFKKAAKEIELNSDKKIFIKKVLIVQNKFSSPVAINSFKKLFIDNIDEREVLNYFYTNFELKTKRNINNLKKEYELLMALKNWENLKVGFPKIY